MVAKQKNVINIECQDGSAGLVLEYVDTQIRLERVEADVREMIVHGAKPALGALSKTIETLLEFHHKLNSTLAVCLVAGSHLDVELVLDVSVEELCLNA